MDSPSGPRIIAVDRFMGDLLVLFSDNRAALFTGDFLYRAISQVEEVFELELEEHIGLGGIDV